ncbi:hypothetical protein B9Z19DRAFT_1118918 [Tuber borchii]|uniref:Uncharacterized protein n=1 Tax=Tuber borchii TaxID=42251 RepID=A0A2T7A748_TUBBO|nr:hypothetical protein B9Z19DRAFT_1118918 [Tuber borchii]
MDKISIADQKAIHALALPGKYTYAAATWYLGNMCQASMVMKLAGDEFEAFKEYVGVSIGVGDVTSDSSDRLTSWCYVVKALKPEGTGMPEQCKYDPWYIRLKEIALILASWIVTRRLY